MSTPFTDSKEFDADTGHSVVLADETRKLERAYRAIIAHWNEFGPEGLDEVIALTAPV